MLAGGAEGQLFAARLERCRARELLNARGWQRADASHVLAGIRALTRLEGAGETMRQALHVLAVVAADWLRQQVQSDRLDRFGPRQEDFRVPTSKAARQVLAETYGTDEMRLVAALDADDSPAWRREIPAVQTLRQVWPQQFEVQEGVARWCSGEGVAPAAEDINLPYYPDARYRRKRTTSWVGDTRHLTETCDDDGLTAARTSRPRPPPWPIVSDSPPIHQV